MKVPKYIQDKMRRVVAHQRKSNRYMWQIEEWLRRNGVDPDSLHGGSKYSLDELEHGNDIIFELVVRIERMMADGTES